MVVKQIYCGFLLLICFDVGDVSHQPYDVWGKYTTFSPLQKKNYFSHPALQEDKSYNFAYNVIVAYTVKS